MATIFCGRNTRHCLLSSLRFLSTDSSAGGYSVASRYSSFSVGRDGRSPAYRRALQCQPPEKIKRYKITSENSVSLIGTIVIPVRRFRPRKGDFCAWSLLESKSRSPFRILLQMQDEVANMALEHLRPNDSVYVLGHLSSYTKVVDIGRSEIFYKVVVNELDFIKDNSQVQTCKTAFEREYEEKVKPISDPLNSDNERDRLHQWQVFFANPHEWWDNRKEKGTKRFPDFKHKDTRECLSLRPNDPPWVRKQLELLDSKMEELGSMGSSSKRSHRMSVWEYDEKAWVN